MIIHSAFTRGLERDLLFYGDADFLYGMNIIPRYLKLSGIRLLAFCLMDNHVHFVLEGCRAGCNQFIINYKRTLLSFLKKCREREIPETTVPGTVGIEGTDRLLTVIAYVLRNPVAAGINYLPQDYKWGSASTYFRKRCNMYDKAANEAYGTARGIMGSTAGSDMGSTDGSDTRSTAVCCTLAVKNSDMRSMTDNNAPTDKCMRRKIEGLPHRERKRCFIDGPEYPGHWTVDGNGMIYPENYIEVAKVEGLFRSVKRYLYYLSSAREAEVNLTMGHEIRLSDTELRREASGICLERFGTTSVGLLTIAQRLQVCKLLRSRFGASYKQLGRVMHMDSDTIREML
ncbi:MAG TPA: hypothetical protein IAC98_01380 [Candidatus Cryptobacteroides pullicola]|nr:hypothetical protein [Candidatus Cryptobacteroides pullicola]